MGAVKENLDYLLGGLKTLEEKSKQTEDFYFKILYSIKLEGAILGKLKLNDTNELIRILNKIDLVDYLDLEEGFGYECVRHTCLSRRTNANFYKHNGDWFYKCFNCVNDKPIAQSKLIIDTIQAQHPYLKYNEVLDIIRVQLGAEFNNEEAIFLKDILEHNINVIETLDKESNLYKLIRKRKLDTFYKDFSYLAMLYGVRQNENSNKISFYASREFIKRFFEEFLEKKANNSVLQKVDLLNALGFLNKVDIEDLNERMLNSVIEYQAKMRMSSKNKKNYLKQVGCFTIEKISSEALNEAERVATIIIDNKINVFTKAHYNLIKEPKTFKEDELNEISDKLLNMLEDKHYIVVKKFKEEIATELTDIELDKILLKTNLMLVKGNKRNKEKYNVDMNEDIKLSDYFIVKKEKSELDKFIEHAGIALTKELNEKGYVLNRDLYKVICGNKKFYKENKGVKVLLKANEKRNLIKNNIGKIMMINGFSSIRCKKDNVELYNIKEDVVPSETILVFK